MDLRPVLLLPAAAALLSLPAFVQSGGSYTMTAHDVRDVFYLINDLFAGGPAPNPPAC